MFGKGRHSSRELVRRLRSENRYFDRQMQLMQARLRKTGELLRTETVQREVVGGRLAAAEGIVKTQLLALQEKNDRIAELERELSERTVEMPLPKLPEPELAGATT